MKRILSALLTALMLLTIVACTPNETNSTPATESTATSTDVSSDVSEEIYKKPDKFYKDRTLSILGKREGAHFYSERQWIYNEELDGEIINDNVFIRNEWIKETFGVTIEYTADTEYFILDTVIQNKNADFDEYDLVCDGLTTMGSLAIQGALDPLNDTEYINVEAPYWDTRCTDALTIGDNVYFLAGDAFITDDEYTYCVLYNKTMFQDLALNSETDGKDVYTVVDEGKWTYDVYGKLSKAAAADIDGVSGMSHESDRWGIVSDTGCVYVMMAGSGYKTIGFDGDGELIVNPLDENAVNVFNAVSEVLNRAESSKYAERIVASDGQYYAAAERMFGENRSFSQICKVNSVSSYASNFDVDFGVLPIPKYTDDQDGYYNSVACLHFSTIGIPTTNTEDAEMTRVVMEALAYKGQELITPAYIETTLKLKKLQDERDVKMLELVLRTRSFDIGVIYDIGKLSGFHGKFAATGNTNITSEWQGIQGAIEVDLNKLKAAFNS
ncbi:MAG: hypothetical protein IJN75_01380 [Clostridia bacterium]|nr:hypothetical protein [Clostridia bacterium]